MTDSFPIRNLRFGLPQVRHSKFVIRHCPDPHDATGRFDFVLANPPFNVNALDTAIRVLRFRARGDGLCSDRVSL